MAAKIWSPVEEEWLAENLARLTLEELAAGLAIGKGGLSLHMKALGLTKPRVMHGSKAPGNPRKMVTRICRNPLCGDTFEAQSYEVNRGNGQFCSTRCTSMAHTLDAPSRELLQSAYLEGLSTNDIARKFGISKGSVYNLFRAYGIATRTLSQAHDAAIKAGKVMGEGKKFHAGYREDLGVSVRSGWEANCLRWLDYEEIPWEYEPTRFQFENAPRGAKSYLPDVYLPTTDQWVEIKGRLMTSDKTRIKRFKKYYPNEFAKLVAIPGSEKDEAAQFFKSMDIPCTAYYRELDKEFKDIVPHWGE